MDGANTQSPDTWSAYGNSHGFPMPNSFPATTETEQHDQTIPSETNSLPGTFYSVDFEDPLSVGRFKNGALWADGQHLQPPRDYHGSFSDSGAKHRSHGQSFYYSNCRGVSKQNTAISTMAVATSEVGTDPASNPQPQTRKRGRPRSQPDTVVAFTSVGCPFQVTSACPLRLEKNLVAARKCRTRKKRYIDNLEERFHVHSTKNKALQETIAMLRKETIALKTRDLNHARCGSRGVDEYIERCANGLVIVSSPLDISVSQKLDL